MHHSDGHTTTWGTATGTVLTVAVNISSQDYSKTVILASVGAAVSFGVSLLLKWLWKQIKG